ncbi:MAG: TdeIII family type II restriction endonuclease [Bacteroidales bacterium]|nr:TdeIII family type II restriction endonuclease [Bacteroidales bacterium]
MIESRKKERIAQTIIKILVSRFSSFPEDGNNNRNAPFHVAFLNAFSDKLNGRVRDIPDYISLSSWLQGLNTSLGQSFFESVAHILCDGEKKDFKGKTIYSNQVNAISEIMIDLKNSTQQPSLERENEIILNNRYGDTQNASNFTADCFYETDNEVVAIELKSVRPNSGEMRGEKQKILQAKAVLQVLYPNKTIKYFFGFPFDPTSSTYSGYDKQRFIKYLVEAEKFIDQSELLIADELWSFLLGEQNGVMDELIHIINTIATPEFMEKYSTIQDKKQGYENILSDWFLTTERFIFDNRNRLQGNSYRKIANQSVFKIDGSYNDKRYELYTSLISQ